MKKQDKKDFENTKWAKALQKQVELTNSFSSSIGISNILAQANAGVYQNVLSSVGNTTNLTAADLMETSQRMQQFLQSPVYEATIRCQQILTQGQLAFRGVSKIYDYTRQLGIRASYILSEDGSYCVDDDEDSEQLNSAERIITEQIINPVSQSKLQSDSPIIVCSPINEKILQYFCENPDRLYALTAEGFEDTMAEIYRNLGYQVERTPATRDGGKDIIITTPTDLGEFIYYVECKRYNPKKPLGVGLIRQFSGTIDADRVNGGIIATTTYFSQPAKDFIIDHNLQCRIKLHDKDYIGMLLKRVIR